MLTQMDNGRRPLAAESRVEALPDEVWQQLLE
jgi:hypothetical protein